MTSIYTCSAVAKLISQYLEKGGQCNQIEEGTLGYGYMVLFGEGLKTAVIKEVYLNEWSSGHTIRMYNQTPKKYKEYCI